MHNTRLLPSRRGGRRRLHRLRTIKKPPHAPLDPIPLFKRTHTREAVHIIRVEHASLHRVRFVGMVAVRRVQRPLLVSRTFRVLVASQTVPLAASEDDEGVALGAHGEEAACLFYEADIGGAEVGRELPREARPGVEGWEEVLEAWTRLEEDERVLVVVVG
jgi:hypothetical protein